MPTHTGTCCRMGIYPLLMLMANCGLRTLTGPSRNGIWESLFKVLAADPDFEQIMIDATIVRAHQHAVGAKGGFKMKPSAARVVG